MKMFVFRPERRRGRHSICLSAVIDDCGDAGGDNEGAAVAENRAERRERKGEGEKSGDRGSSVGLERMLSDVPAFPASDVGLLDRREHFRNTVGAASAARLPFEDNCRFA